MLEVGQHYHKNGIEYEVKDFEINGNLIRLQLVNIANNQPLAVNTTITQFVSSYSRVLPSMEFYSLNHEIQNSTSSST